MFGADKDGLPTVRGRLTYDGARIWVKCPLCAFYHQHGGPEGGPRLSHCDDPSLVRGYHIRVALQIDPAEEDFYEDMNARQRRRRPEMT